MLLLCIIEYKSVPDRLILEISANIIWTGYTLIKNSKHCCLSFYKYKAAADKIS